MILHYMVECVRWKKPIIFEIKRSTSAKVNNLGDTSKILNFHLIDLKFEKDLYITLLNSNGQLFLLVNIHQKVNN